MSDTKTKDARERADEASARILELETELAEARAAAEEANRDLVAEAEAARLPQVEQRKRKRDFTLEVKGPRPVDLADRQLIPGDEVKASELQETMGDKALTLLLTMGWFKVLDENFPRGPLATDELRGDEAVWVATGIEFERPTVVSEPVEDMTAKWQAEADMLAKIKADNEDQGVKDNQQRILDQQTAEVARFSDAQAAMRVDDQGRAPEPGVQLTTAGGPVVEDGEIANADRFVEAAPSDDDEFVEADDHHAGTPSDPQTPDEQRFDSAAVADMTVDEVKDYVDTFPAERREEVLMKVLDVEAAGKNRKTLISWIEEEVGE